MKIFMENKHKVAKHNAKYEMGLVSYKLGLNKYADMVSILYLSSVLLISYFYIHIFRFLRFIVISLNYL